MELFDKQLKCKLFEEYNKFICLFVFSSASYLNSFRETGHHRLNVIRVHTLSSLRSSSHFMRSGMHMLTTQVSSLRDYCGVTTGHFVSKNYLLQQQHVHCLQYSPSAVMHIRYHELPTVMEDEQSQAESKSLTNHAHVSSYVGYIPSEVSRNGSIAGQLDENMHSVQLALNDFIADRVDIADEQGFITGGFMIGGFGTFHDRAQVINDEHIEESERLIDYGEQRPIG